MIRMLGLDPGTNNFAFSAVEGNGKKFNILEHGMIRNPFKNMKGDDVGKRGRKFVLEVREIVRYFKITHSTAERFQTRGPKGTTVEEVNNLIKQLYEMRRSMKQMSKLQDRFKKFGKKRKK